MESLWEVRNRMVAKYATRFPEVDPVILPDVQVDPSHILDVPAEKAFLVEVPNSEKLYITGRAGGLRQLANQHGQAMATISGRYVGADRPNRNGQMWSTGDLEFGLPSVVGGPANLLHEEHQIVGAITDVKFNYDTASLGNHLTVDVALWRFLYPGPVDKIREASEKANLFLSMECVAEKVQCAAIDGCGESFDYRQYMRNKASTCSHLARGGTRRLENPTFLGVGILYGGVQPGWKDATAEMQREASQMADRNNIDRDTAMMIADQIMKWSVR